MIYTVALTGGIGSGKNTIANMFAKFGITIIDSDIIARKVVEPGTSALCAIMRHFGSDIINTDNTLNRRLLRERIFFSPNKRKWLNALLHPLIYQIAKHQMKQAISPYVLWIVPLLLENQLQKKANRVLVIDITPEEQIHRTMIRDKISLQHARRIIFSQATREERLTIADDIINNNNLKNIAADIERLHEQYLTFSVENSLKNKKRYPKSKK